MTVKPKHSWPTFLLILTLAVVVSVFRRHVEITAESAAGEAQVRGKSSRRQAVANYAPRERDLRPKMNSKSFADVSAVAMAHQMTLSQIRLRDTEGRRATPVYDDEMRGLIRQLRRLAKTKTSVTWS